MRSKTFKAAVIALCAIGHLSALAADKSTPNGQLTMLTVVAPTDDQASQRLGFRQVSGEFELGKPAESVRISMSVCRNGIETDPFGGGWVLPRGAQHGKFSILFINLEDLPIVVNSNDLSTHLRPQQILYKHWLFMGENSEAWGSAPADADRLIDLHNRVEYFIFDRSAASDAIAPLFAMYSGIAPLEKKDVRTLEELLKLNPKGDFVIASLHFNDHPKFPIQPK